MKNTTRLFSLLLSVVMLICIIPQSVLAEIGEMISGNNSEATNQSSLSNNDTTADAFVYVLGEVIEKRTETTKTFRMSDGSLVAADYGKTIHFADDNGNWQDYDNTLSYSNASSADSEDVNGYGIAKSNIAFKLANNSNSSNLLKITKDDYKISINLVDADKSKAIEVYKTTDKPDGNDINSVAKLYKFSSGAIYKDILPSTDLEYIISGGSIKENIIVKEKCDSYTYTFELKLKGLVPALCEDGSISLNDENTDEPVLVIPKGYMYDANGECSEDVAYSIVHKNGKKYTLAVSADSEWINSAERVFPITIDPTVEAYQSTVTTFDTYISQQTPSANYYKNSTILAGYYGSDTSKENHILIRAKDLPTLPSSAVIIDARMCLAHLNTEHTSVNLAAVSIKDSWDVSTVTWNTKPNYETSNAVLDYAILNESTQLSETNTNPIQFDITRLAQQWYNNTANNNGVAIIPLSGSGTGRIYFASSDYHDGTDPRLYISYRDTKGLESIWNYSSHGAGNAGVGYVNGFNGNLVFVHDDMATRSSKIPMVVSHVYNSFHYDKMFNADSADINAPITADYSKMLVGFGWKLSIQETIVKRIIGDNSYYVYNDADGTELYFKQKKDDNKNIVENEYVSEDGYGLTLDIKSTGITLKDDYGNEKYFDASGRLVRITDVYGNSKSIVYNALGNLTSVTHTSAGTTVPKTQLEFYYNTTNSLIKIENACDTTDYVEFFYSPNLVDEPTTYIAGYLRKIQYSDGAYSLYNYNADGTLSSVTDGDTGYTVSYEYTSYNGVQHVSSVTESVGESIGQKLGFTYGDKLFKIRSSGGDDTYNTNDDIITTALFDNLGHTICSYSSDVSGNELYGASYADYTPYESASKTNNKITAQSVKGITLENLISNSNCETTSSWNASVNNGYSASRTSEHRRFGSYSLKLSGANSDGSANYSTSVTIPSAGTYTLSAYVKLSSVVSENGGVSISVGGAASEYLTGTTNSSVDNGWERISCTFDAPASGTYTVKLSLTNASGTAFFDCIQLEKYDTPSEYNFVSNGSIRGSSSWSGNFITTSSEASRGHVGRLNGVPTSTVQAYQTVDVNCPSDTTFMLSGWAKASSVDVLPDDVKYDESEENSEYTRKKDRRFGMKAVITYSDGSTENRYVSFNPDNTLWQYASIAIVPNPKNDSLVVKRITVYLCYDYNANVMYFDDICLTVEPAQTYEYDKETGKLKTLTDADGNKSLMDYTNGVDMDGFTAVTGEEYEIHNDEEKHHVDYVEKTANGVTQTLTYDYDAYGNQTESVLSNSVNQEIITSYVEYDEDGEYIERTIDSLGNTTSYDYDGVTKLLTFVTDANSNRVGYTYDSRDRVSYVYNDADGDSKRGTAESYVRYLYTKNRLSSIWTNTTRYSILTDSFGNTTAIKAGTNTLATYEYAPNNGKLLKMTYGNGDYEEYVYDKLDRLVETKYNGTVENTVKYNANGAVSEITDGDVTHIYKYDSLGRLIRAYQKDSSGNVTMAVENSYDDLGRAKGSTYVVDGKTLSYTLSYTTDSSLVDSVLLPKSGSVQSSLGYTYDEFDRLVKKNFSFSTMKNAYEEYDYYSYVKDNKTHTTALVSSLSLVSESGTDTYNYTYDNLGNILTVSKNGAPVESYEYDSLNQLTRENNLAAGYTKLYSYDPMGNITSKVEIPFTLAPTASLDTSNGTVTSYGYASGGLLPWGDMLVNYNGTAITYDNIGNPLNWRNASEFVWSAKELVSANLSNGNTVSYTYNADGIRTQKVYNGTTHNYTLDGSKIIKEEVSVNGNTSYELYYIYDISGSVIGFHYNNAPYYFLKNLQGDVVSIVNAMGIVVVEYTYDAWGKVLSTTGTLASTIGAYNPFRYRGYYYDSETDWYYLQSRYYDPIVGRFLNADGFISTGQGFVGNNMFAYCGSNPVNYVDSSGYLFEWIKEKKEEAEEKLNEMWEKAKEIAEDLGNTIKETANDVYEWIDNNVGGATYSSTEASDVLVDNIFCTVTAGSSSTSKICGDDDKMVVGYLQNASDWYDLDEYAAGIQLNTDDGGCGVAITPAGLSYEICINDKSISWEYGLRYSFTISKNVDFDNHSAEDHLSIAIRPIGQVALAVCVAFPELFPVLSPALNPSKA